MTEITVLLEKNDIYLLGDKNNIIVPRRYVKDVKEWCKLTGIKAHRTELDHNPSLIPKMLDVSLWHIPNEEQRLIFALRWS